MALLWVATELSRKGVIGPVRAAFVHHGTRSGQDEDQKIVTKFCQSIGIELKVLRTLELKGVSGNFEKRARDIRRSLLFNELGQGENLWLGHHLNDSYEWNLMQRSRSSRVLSSLGIPVRNGPIIRPFLCVSRKQIKRLIVQEKIPYRDDPTNMDLNYDRNYVRHEIVRRIEKRYPKHLKHYVNIVNQAAMHMNVSVLSPGALTKVYAYDEGAVLIGQKFDLVQIQELLHNYSRADRGELVGTIGKMLQAIRNGKKGPFQFSGGLEAYHTHQLLMIYPKGMKNHDQTVARVLTTLPEDVLESVAVYDREELSTAFENFLKLPDALCDMPGIVLVLEKGNVCKTLNCSVYDALFPEVSKVCQERGFRFTTYTKCLERWKTREKSLPEKLRLLPLHHLSHLFSFQQ